MSFITDRFWLDALGKAIEAAGGHDRVFVPREFLPLHPKFFPIEYSEIGIEGSEAFCCPKDDIDKVSIQLRDRVLSSGSFLFANEVFALGSTRVNCLPYVESDVIQRHTPYLLEKVEKLKAGDAVRDSKIHRVYEPVHASSDGRSRTVLVMNACGMANIGDDLISERVCGWVRDAAPSCRVIAAEPSIDRSVLSQADMLILGGGGFLYDMDEDGSCMTNIVNYFRYGYMAHELGIPYGFVGIGHQGMVSPYAWEYVIGAMKHARFITTRDQETAEMIRSASDDALAVRGLADVVFGIEPGELSGVHSSDSYRILITGCINSFGERYLEAIVETLREQQASGARGRIEVEYLIMAIEDEQVARDLRELLDGSGISLNVHRYEIEDRGDLFSLFAGVDGVISARYHGTILAMLHDRPVVSLDRPFGKKYRLFEEAIGGGAQARLIVARQHSNQDMKNACVELMGWSAGVGTDGSVAQLRKRASENAGILLDFIESSESAVHS